MFSAERMNLSISGESVVLKSRYQPQLGTRKIYNSKFFHNEEYHHEIANHYRDFKRRPRIHRRRRNIYVRYKKASSAIPLSMNPFEYRDELPMAVHDFPRFALIHTPPRGRQCQCESQPPDETYNDSVRRIRAAKSSEELKALVQRYYGYVVKRTKYYRQQKNRKAKYEKNETRLNECETDSKQQSAARRQRQLSLGNLKSVATACSKQKTLSNVCNDHDKTTIASTKLYLQLASEHYEREYLVNVKYLESIPERNALIRYTRGNDDSQTAKLSTFYKNNWNYSRLGSTKSNASNSLSNTDETTKTATCELNCRIANLLRLIGRKRSFRISSNNSPAYETLCGNKKNWDIRVNIKTATGESVSTPQIPTTETKHSRKDSNTVCVDSMHDFLNANTEKSIQISETTTFNNNNNNINSTNGLVPNQDWSTEHLHNIIDNLKQLDLNALNARVSTGSQQGLIPSITLSDYCDLTRNQYFEGQIQLDFNNIDNQALTSAQSACNSTSLLKSTKFVYKPNLNIPSEINYQSEARPP